MQLLSATTRRQNLNALQQERFDVLVIGGGVTGAGVALEAAVRGYRVALVEKADFAGGTSSKSTKLVHGGIRYLPNFDFPLVHESLVERGLLLHNAPFLVQPLAFVLPLYRGDRHPVGIPFTTPGGVGLSAVLDIGLTLYDLMAGRYGIARHRRLSRQEVLRYAPDLVSTSLKGGFLYYDAQTNDARLTMTLIRTAARYGAVIANYCEAVALLLDKKGRVCGARLRDSLDGAELTVQARHVVNATGVFAERVEALCGLQPRVSIEPSKGVHLVFSREDLHVGEAAVVLPETEDRRILFIVPWQSRVIVGTTDTGSGDLDHPLPDTADIAYLLKHLNRYLSLRLTPEQIISSYAGYRPLFKPSEQSGADTARLSRTHAVLENEAGLVTIVGGKLTTYRRMAQDTLDRIDERDGRQPRHPTLRLRLAGSEDWSRARSELEQQATTAGLASDITAHLLQSYGTETRTILQLIADDPMLAQRLVADLPYIRAEVIYACRYEMAMTPADVLARRTSLILEDRRRGLEALETVAALMAPEQGWSPEQVQRLTAAYRQEVERQLAAEEARLSA
ncbi:glycerol-3-phosphate dehydrogenase/oxidase [Thermogemmatispora sp.]|uniref:glycerol-3-phosphate dehydrogenase/oxidase n=1 Tax=Thermogemmatispora sp. TaxID=1968838 RepID=UPI001DB123A3|nr:glycerol-3-phosphate dehydrogenase/oxidase [Thermogemmatispora sp.]MBX5448937.1 glycerol-3-phosphate dehydrogenase/oxidase [Thermogemmatispora sp.]